MTARGVPLCPNTAAKLLKQEKYSLRVNRKSIAETQHPDRNQQFELIASFRKRFEDAGSPILSMDTKKKELIGNFRNAGRAWRKEPELVNQHDFRSQASAFVSPYGLTNRFRIAAPLSSAPPPIPPNSRSTPWTAGSRKSAGRPTPT